jgi:cation/acetate symporter
MASILEEARRLGKLYALLATAFVLFVVVVAMLSQFGLPEPVTTFLVVLVTVATYAVMGLVTRTLSLQGFFLADRFVPAGLNGMAAAAAILAFPFIGLAGAFLADRLLGLAIVAGLVAGFVLLAVVVAPYYRKSGGLTLPDYLAVRYGNQLIRLAAVVIIAVALFPVLVAMIGIATDIAVATLRFSPRFAVIAVVAVLLLTTLLGGLRSTTLSGGAQALVALIAILVPAVLVSVQEYGFPLPQTTLGNALQEAAAEAGAILVLPGRVLPAGALDGFNLAALAICLAAGIAAFPQVAARFGAAHGIGDARRTAGWALLVVGLLAATAPAIAAFVRLAILRDVVGVELADVPQWLFDYGRTGLIEVCGVAPLSPAAIGSACGAATVVNGLAPTDIALSADLVTLGFADITGLPYIVTALIATGAIAATLGTAAAALTTLGSVLGNDFLARFLARRASGGRRLLLTRVALIAVAAAAAWLAHRGPDAVTAWALAAPSIAAAGLFPALFLGVFWQRTTFWGALLGMVAGGGATIAYVFLVLSGGMTPLTLGGLAPGGLSAAAAGILGLPLGFLVAIAGSLLTASPSLVRRAVVDAIRRPSPDPILEDHAT